MAKFVYIDETGSVGASLRKQPYLTLVAAIVDEDQVQALAESLRRVTMKHLGWIPADFELHGHDIWNGIGHWKDKKPPELLAAYDAVLELLDLHDIELAHSTIDRARLHSRYRGAWDENAYLLSSPIPAGED